jgi:ribonuclease BN (tRNA processing enzyme)
MDEIKIITLGTGGSFGRILGYEHSYNFIKRGNSSTSMVFYSNNKEIFHVVIDVGAPCVEKIIDSNIKRIPDILFVTHLHNDHISDFDKFVASRYRGLIINERNKMRDSIEEYKYYDSNKKKEIIQNIKKSVQKNMKLPVIASYNTVNNERYGLRNRFCYLDKHIDYNIPNDFSLWYSFDNKKKKMVISDEIENSDFPLDFKFIELEHKHAAGACMFIFRLKKNKDEKFIFSGDFLSENLSEFNKNQLKLDDIKNPSFVLLETSSIMAQSHNHTSWKENENILNNWFTKSKEKRPLVVLNHIGGYEDLEQGIFEEMPTDMEWQNEIKSSLDKLKDKIDIKISEDGNVYTIYKKNKNF